MKIRVPDYYKNFKCIAGDCTDTCCAGWEVDVDDASYEYYTTITGPFGDRLKSVMIDGTKKAEGRFRIRPDGRCPFLNDNNLCDLYKELGEDALCVTCDQYPRYTSEYGNLREVGVALSCKTAAELILKNQHNGFTESKNDEAPSLNNIDAELYFKLSGERDKAFEIISNRKISIWERMILFLDMGEKLQKEIKKYRKTGIFTRENEPKEIIKSYFNNFKKLHIIKPEWPQLIDEVVELLDNREYENLRQEFNNYYKDREYEYENILYYFTFRYFLKGVLDKHVLDKVKIGIISTIIIHECDIAYWWKNGKKLTFSDQIELTHMYSRELEHSEENFSKLCKLLMEKSVFSCNTIRQILRRGI